MDHLKVVCVLRGPLLHSVGQFLREAWIQLDGRHVSHRIDQSKRERSETRADLNNVVCCIDAGFRNNLADRIRVMNEVLPQFLRRMNPQFIRECAHLLGAKEMRWRA